MKSLTMGDACADVEVTVRYYGDGEKTKYELAEDAIWLLDGFLNEGDDE